MCGIAGIISTEPTKFNINHFNILGTLNDERGGDSCGIFIDKKYQYGIKDIKQFRVFTRCIKDYPDTARIAILHCRKGSTGYALGIEQAQPVIIKNGEDIEFVLIHNGTITNAPELAKKHIPEVDVKGLTDSQVMTHIIYHRGYDVLTEYKGTAVFVTIDYRNDIKGEVKIWKGNSCYNEYNEQHERPLFFAVYENKFYFSSMLCSLYCIDSKIEVFTVPTNQLMKVENNELKAIKYYDRSTLKKYEPVQSSFDWDKYYSSSNYNSKVEYITYNQYTGLYMKNGQPAYGEFKLFQTGLITESQSSYSYPFYFAYGRLLYNKESYDFIQELQEMFDDTLLREDIQEIVDYFSYNPLKRANKFYEVFEDMQYYELDNGTWFSLFTNPLKYHLKNGRLEITDASAAVALSHFQHEAKTVYFNFDILRTDCLNRLVAKCCDVPSI